MIKRKVIRYVLCKLDGREYQIGDTYQSKDQSRIDELTELGYLEDEDAEDDGLDHDQLKHVGGGYYELPNGEKVRGKEAALEALEALDQE